MERESERERERERHQYLSDAEGHSSPMFGLHCHRDGQFEAMIPHQRDTPPTTVTLTFDLSPLGRPVKNTEKRGTAGFQSMKATRGPLKVKG